MVNTLIKNRYGWSFTWTQKHCISHNKCILNSQDKNINDIKIFLFIFYYGFNIYSPILKINIGLY